MQNKVNIIKKTASQLLWVAVAVATAACSSGKPNTPTEHLEQIGEEMAEQREILEEIKSDVESIKQFIDQARRPGQGDAAREVSIDDDYIKGNADAELTLIEFSDFQCPYCARFYKETLPLIQKEYIDTGKVRMVYRDFPLSNAHPEAQKAAEAAQCAGEQGKFWEMHDKLFDKHSALAIGHIKRYARELGLSGKRFDECVDSGRFREEVLKDLQDGQAAGVQGTPTFFLGRTQPGKTINGVIIRGARPYISFKQAFERMLQEP